MRVIAGSAKGTKLFPPQGISTRPTSDFVKGNLFNIIQADLRGANFLDLFAGTGAVGIEALSRGARAATFVDTSLKCISLMVRNLEKTRLYKQAVVIKGELPSALRKLDGQQFDIIFLDPPYCGDFVRDTLAGISEHKLLGTEGCVVLEISSVGDAPVACGLEVLKEKKYGGAKLVFLGGCV